jgi:hypothetical protein
LRHRYHRATPGPLRLHRISCNRNRWTRDGKTRRQRLPLWRDRRHHDRGLRSPARRRTQRRRGSGSARLRERAAYVGSVGPLDMVNFCAINTVPAQYAGRKLQRHNPQVTLMRTTAAESRQIGFWMPRSSIVATARSASSSLKKGPRRWTRRGQPFHDPIVDAALFEAIEQTFVG